MILPLRVLGRSSVKMIVFGRAMAPMLGGHVLAQLLAVLGVGLDAALQRDEGDDGLAGGVVLGPDDGRLGHRSGGRRAPTRPRWSRCGGRDTFMTSSTRPSSQR